MSVRSLTLAGVLVCLCVSTGRAAAPNPNSTEDLINSYIAHSFAKDLNGTLDLFENSASTYFHINGIYYFTVDAEQQVFQVLNAKNYVDTWAGVYQGFADYFTTLIEALDVKTVVRTAGQPLHAPLDGGDKIDGETAYVILAKFYVDAEGHTGYGLVHGLDQFRIKHGKIANALNLEKTVFLTQAENDYVDSLATSAAKIAWGRNRACELGNSVFATIDFEKRYDVALGCQ